MVYPPDQLCRELRRELPCGFELTYVCIPGSRGQVQGHAFVIESASVIDCVIFPNSSSFTERSRARKRLLRFLDVYKNS